MAIGQGIYFIKKGTEQYQDITTKFKGVNITSIEGFLSRGEPKNVYTAEWVDSSEIDVIEPEEVKYATTDVKITFYVNQFFYTDVNVLAIHDAFVDYLTSGRFMMKSTFVGKENEFICLEKYEPTLDGLKRAEGSKYIMGTITLKKVNSLNTNI